MAFTITLLSICMVFPGPPSIVGELRSFHEQMSRKYWYHCTAVGDDTHSAEHHLHRCFVHPQEQQPAEFLHLQPAVILPRMCPSVDAACIATQTVQHVANDGDLVLEHGVVLVVRLTVKFSWQYTCILQVLQDLLLSSANECSEVVQIHVDVDVDLGDDECDQECIVALKRAAVFWIRRSQLKRVALCDTALHVHVRQLFAMRRC